MIRLRKEQSLTQGDLWVIPSDWEEQPISSFVVGMEKGYPPKRRKATGSYPYLSVGYLRGEEEPVAFCSPDDGLPVEEGDVLLIWDGAANAGEVLRGKRGALGSTLMRLNLNQTSDGRYLYTALKFFEDEIKSLRIGTDDRHVDRGGLLQFVIPSPKSDEQHSIGLLLYWFDELIEVKRRQNRLLELTATALFRNWFVDFEPFRENKFVASELGEIPKDWEVKPISELATLRNGFSYGGQEKFSDETEGSYLFITLNNFVEGGGFKPEPSWVESDRLADHHFLEEGDLIMTNTHFGVGGSDVGRLLATPALVSFPPGYRKSRAVYSHHVTRISPFDVSLKEFLYLYLKATWEDSISFSTGTGVLGLDLRNFRVNKLVLVPPKEVVGQFSDLVRPMFRKVILNHRETTLLSRVRTLLAEPLIFGRLRVEEI